MAIAIALSLIVVGAAAAAYFVVPRRPTPVSSSTSNSQATSEATTSGRSSGGLTITNMFADVIGPGYQAPTSNSSSVADRSTFDGYPGETFDVVFGLVYQDCSSGCPAQVTSVISLTPGFMVTGTTPSLPVQFAACGFICTDGAADVTSNGGMETILTVNVTASPTPYSGTLTLEAQAG